MANKPRVFRPIASLPPTPDLRPTRQARGYDEQWLRLRASVLATYPYCAHCGEPATDVDHVIPKAIGQHACDTPIENLQSLCRPCHSRKTAQSRRR
jgi:5-methylcytosine-specific restriction protein A